MDTAVSTPSSIGSGVSEGARVWSDRYRSATDELADVAGLINAGHGRLVDVVLASMAEAHHVGPGLHTPGQYVAWQTGVSKATADAVVRLARRAEELPCLLGALRAGEISLDQADVVARNVSAAYDRDATELARSATVAQLKVILPHYRDRKDPAPRSLGFGTSHQGDGTATVSGRLSEAQAEVVDRALQAIRDDLYRQAKADVESAKAEGLVVDKAKPPTSDEVLVAMAEAALRAGEQAHPGSDRYTVGYHLHLGPDGKLQLTDEAGRPVAEAFRRQLLCDHACEAVFHDDHGTPLSVGRLTRQVGRKLRRAILFRHRHRCAVPGCATTVGLEIHHIIHWEDGGPTDTGNLLALCGHHHRAHHQGHLVIEGDADLPAGAPGAVEILTPKRTYVADEHQDPTPVRGPETQRTLHRLRAELDRRTKRRRHHHANHPHPWAPTASTPTGERLRRSDIHLGTTTPTTPTTVMAASSTTGEPTETGPTDADAPTPLRT